MPFGVAVAAAVDGGDDFYGEVVAGEGEQFVEGCLFGDAITVHGCRERGEVTVSLSRGEVELLVEPDPFPQHLLGLGLVRRRPGFGRGGRRAFQARAVGCGRSGPLP